MEHIVRAVERVIAVISIGSAAVLLAIMICGRIWEIVTRNLFDSPSGIYDYMEREAFVLLVLLSIGFAYLRDSHVRVDIVRDQMSSRLRAVLEILSFLFLILPLVILTLYFGIQWIAEIKAVGERSALALGQPWGWVIHGALPFGIGLLGVAGAAIAVRNARHLLSRKGSDVPPVPAADQTAAASRQEMSS